MSLPAIHRVIVLSLRLPLCIFVTPKSLLPPPYKGLPSTAHPEAAIQLIHRIEQADTPPSLHHSMINDLVRIVRRNLQGPRWTV